MIATDLIRNIAPAFQRLKQDMVWESSPKTALRIRG